MKTQTRRDVLLFIASVLTSSVAAVVFYRPFFIFFNRLFGPGIEFTGFVISHNLALRIVVFDIAYVFFLAFFLSFPLFWRKTIRFWAYGYLLLIGLSLFAAGIYIPNPLRLFFILVSASVGFLLGQGIRFAIFSITGWRHFALDSRIEPVEYDPGTTRPMPFRLPTRREFGILAICVAVSVFLGVSLYQQFFDGLDYFLGIFGGGFYTIEVPPYSTAWLINATLGLSFPLYLSFFLSLFFRWRRIAILWIVGYIAFVVELAMFYNPLFIPDVHDIPQVAMFGLIGFIIGQGIRFAITRLAKSK